MATSIRKKLDTLCSSIFDEMDEDQLKALYNFVKSSTGSGTQEVSEEDEDEEDEAPKKKKRVVEEDDDEEEVVTKKGKKAAVEEDEDEDEEDETPKKKRRVVEEDEDDEEEDEEDEKPKKKKKAVEEEDEDEDEDEDAEDEDDEEEVKPKKSKKKAADEDDEEDEDDEDSDDLSSKSVPALKKLAVEAGYDAADLKAALKKSTDEKKTLIKLISKFNETVETLTKKKLEVLEKLATKHDVKYSKPRGRSGEPAKKLAAAKALAAAGYPFDE